jgi:catechol 2,3-dioxygenase-like lactoylglutathione lyase family enzyme
MNRFHVHLQVHDIAQSVQFYSTLFGAPPSKREADYAKWMLDDPRVNFAISAHRGEVGLSHLGIQVEDEAALSAVSARAKQAAGEVLIEDGANCCYAVSDKAWANDPQGVRWETFRTSGDLTTYGVGAQETRREGTSLQGAPAQSACCTPEIAAQKEPDLQPAAATCCNQVDA